MIDVRTLATEGRVYVPYPQELRVAMEDAMEAWKKFCMLPNEQKLQFGYDPDAKTSGNGYELHLSEEGAKDKKEDFHLREVHRDDLMKRALLVDETITPEFVQKALALNPLMAPILREFAANVEKELDVPGFEADVMSYQPKWLIRFLHYFGDRQPGEEIAAPHNDKGGFTLHLYESHPGVQQLTYDTKEWIDMPLSHDETVIIPGMGLQNRSQCKLRATCHRVIATEETAQIGRFSAVCFFNFANVRFFDKQTFGSQQKYAPGFFYDMPFAEFDKYFID